MLLKVIKSQQCSVSLWKDLMLSRPNPFQTTNGYRSTSHKSLQKSKDFFIQLLFAWLHLTNDKFPTFISAAEILDQLIFFEPHTRMDFRHPTKEYFKFTIITGIFRFLQAPLPQHFIRILLDFPTVNHKRYLNLLWTQLPVIGNNYLELKLLKNPF